MHTQPSLSANRLGRYLTASPAGRKSLILGAQRQEDVAFRWYDAARAIMADFLTTGAQPERLAFLKQRLAEEGLRDEAEARRVSLCLEALERFQEMLPALKLERLTFQAPREEKDLELAGVKVQVRPNAIIIDTSRPGGPQVGLVNFYCSKHEPAEPAAAYTTTLMRVYAEQHLSPLGKVNPRLVWLVDVFAGRVHEAPQAATRRLQDVTLGCEEVAARWGHVH